MLEKTASSLSELGWCIGNVDATIVAQEPRFSAFIDQITEKVSQAVGIDSRKINVKATTTDGLGFPGRGEGIAAYAIALTEERE